MSARDHFELREAQRQTWIQWTQKQPHLLSR